MPIQMVLYLPSCQVNLRWRKPDSRDAPTAIKWTFFWTKLPRSLAPNSVGQAAVDGRISSTWLEQDQSICYLFYIHIYIIIGTDSRFCARCGTAHRSCSSISRTVLTSYIGTVPRYFRSGEVVPKTEVHDSRRHQICVLHTVYNILLIAFYFLANHHAIFRLTARM